jgi:hypothetical protein
MRKEAHSIHENDAVYDPPDADHTWTVKVRTTFQNDKIIDLHTLILVD